MSETITISTAPSIVDPVMWMSDEPTSPVWTSITSPPTKKVETLVATARLNKKSLEPLAKEASFRKLRERLIKDLVRQMTSDVSCIKISSETNPKNGSTTFKATLEVVVNEQKKA